LYLVYDFNTNNIIIIIISRRISKTVQDRSIVTMGDK